MRRLAVRQPAPLPNQVLPPHTLLRRRQEPAESPAGGAVDAGVRRLSLTVCGEHGVVALAPCSPYEHGLRGEAAALRYHLSVLLRARGLARDNAMDVLRERQGRGR